MVWKNHLLLLFLVLACLLELNGQVAGYEVKRFAVEDGLPSPKINTLYEDGYQQLWIGTNTGLVRYDGYEFKHFSIQEGLRSENILAIVEDAEGGLWAGGNKGIVLVEGDTCQSLPIDVVGNTYFLNCDFEGNIWCGNGGNLYFYSKEKIEEYHQTKEIQVLTSEVVQPETLFPIIAITQDEIGQIYVTGKKGIFRINKNKKIEKVYTRSKSQLPATQLLSWSKDSLFWGDKTGNIYLTTSDTTRFLKSVCNNELCGLVGIENWKNNLTLLFDENILFYTHESDTAEYLIPESWNVRGRRCLLADKKGNLWIGTTEGLVLVTAKQFENKNYPKSLPEIYSIVDYGNGLLLGGNQGKVIHYDSLAFQLFSPPKVRPAGEIRDIQLDHLGGLWFVSYWQGISRFFNGKMQGFFYGDFSKEEPDLICLLEDSKHQIWAGGLNHIFKITMDWEKGGPNDIKKISSPKRGFQKLVEDKDGILWAASTNGLFKIDQDSLILIDLKTVPLNTNFTDALWNGDELWLTTQGAGVVYCKKKSSGDLEVLRSLTVKNGLRNNYVQCLEQDAQGNIWVGTYMGLSRINTQNFIVHNYNQDGLTEEPYFNIALHRDPENRMWCATTNGLFSFDPAAFTFSKGETSTHFSEIRVNDNPLKNYEPKSFKHNQSSFKFKFLNVNTAYANLVLYRYRLKGLKEAWSAPSSLREIRYDFLPPGDYEFEVKTSSVRGEWSSDSLRYAFTINAPFWEKISFRIFSFLLLGAIIWLLFLRRIRKIKKQEQEKSKVRQLITELESKALRAQMNPHFVFNCMNAIQEQILMKEIQSAYTYLSKFARLMRMVLEHSSEHALTIEEEVTMLKLYLELESLRFDGAFEYAIDCDGDASFLLLPNLMIQPFVENAIWHGLLPKKGKKKLQIKFNIQEKNILCSIEDNGIGRAAAALRQQEQTNVHRSHAIGLVKKRLELINKNRETKATLTMTDLLTENLEAKGTLIEINLPIDWQNYWNNETTS